MELPEGFVDWARGCAGLDGEALIESLQLPAAVAVRVNRRKTVDDTVGNLYPEGREVEWCASGLRLPERPIFTLNPLLHAGVFYVQDPSSMIHEQIASLLAERLRRECEGDEALKVLDFCAAPGGKTTAMIGGLPEGTQVVANEVDGHRRNILRENLEKWGYPYVAVAGSRSSDFASLGPEFDFVAVDAPCSGEGMMRKEMEARRQWGPRLIADCAALQRELLEDVVCALKPGGYLIYSTCTFNPEENERNVAWLRDVLGLEPMMGELLPDMKGVERAGREIEGDIPCLRFMPHLTDGEGLFVTVMRKPATAAGELASGKIDVRTMRRLSGRRHSGNNASNEPEMPWMRDDMIAVESRDNPGEFTALPREMGELVGRMRSAGVRVVEAGLPAGVMKGRELQPDGRAALSLAFEQDSMPDVALSEEDALRYLRMETVRLPEYTPKGYVTVSYEGHRLGMMKNLGQRANSLWPKLWRVKMA